MQINQLNGIFTIDVRTQSSRITHGVWSLVGLGLIIAAIAIWRNGGITSGADTVLTLGLAFVGALILLIRGISMLATEGITLHGLRITNGGAELGSAKATSEKLEQLRKRWDGLIRLIDWTPRQTFDTASLVVGLTLRQSKTMGKKHYYVDQIEFSDDSGAKGSLKNAISSHSINENDFCVARRSLVHRFRDAGHDVNESLLDQLNLVAESIREWAPDSMVSVSFGAKQTMGVLEGGMVGGLAGAAVNSLRQSSLDSKIHAGEDLIDEVFAEGMRQLLDTHGWTVKGS